ncbi:MAG: RloB domain-containing protein [Propionibacterium sp.]|nr:RloB domain-containing protein [Propionibacterium sp.]
MTEGQATEPQYVERLNQHLRDGPLTVSVRTVGVGKDPRLVVKKCVEERDRAAKAGKSFDHCVCLVDVDQHTTLAEAITTAAVEGIDVIVSRLKFEVWLLWHASESGASNTSRQLDELMSKHQLLTNSKHLSPHFPVANVDAATRRAFAADAELAPGRIGPDPSSAMPILVEMMRGK